jgi:hypothetical protein
MRKLDMQDFGVLVFKIATIGCIQFKELGFFFPELPLKEEYGTIVRQSPKKEYIICPQ